jgi:hypothetical protein
MNSEQLSKEVSEMMEQIETHLRKVYALIERAEKFGVHVPDCVLTGRVKAKEWWSYSGERILAKQKKREARKAALSKLTKEDREVLGL